MDKAGTVKKARGLYILAGALIALALMGAAAVVYGYQRLTKLTKEVSVLHNEIASTTSALSGDIAETNTNLTSDLANQVKNVTAVSNQVNTLQKLQHIDPQLLAKYSKVYFLNEN